MIDEPFTPFIVEPCPDGRGARIRIGDAHSHLLTLGEILEQVMALMRHPIREPYPMRTEEEWEAMLHPRHTVATGDDSHE